MSSLLKKSLRLIKLESGKVESGDNIIYNDRNIGQITSIIEDKGLAIIKIKEADYAKENNNILFTNEGRIKIIN